MTQGFVAFPHQSLRVQLPTWLPSKAQGGGGGRSRHVLPKTSPIWESKSELEEVRVRLPLNQGRGNSRNGDCDPVGPSCGFPRGCRHGGEGMDAGNQGLCSRAGGDRIPWISLSAWEGAGVFDSTVPGGKEP